MVDGERNPFLIVPPPGLAPAPKPTEPEAPDAGAVHDRIGLPPGVMDSGTHRVAAAQIAPPIAPPSGPTSAAPIAWAAPVVPPAVAAAPPVQAAPPVEAAPAPAVSTEAALPTAPTPVAAPSAPHARVPEPTGTVLTLADGTTHRLRGSVLIGRDPAAVASWQGAALLAVTDPEKSVSKTHAAIIDDNGGIWVHDLGSTNGVIVTHADGSLTVVEPAQRAAVRDGDTVGLGKFSILVARG